MTSVGTANAASSSHHRMNEKNSNFAIGLKFTVCAVLVAWANAALNGQEIQPRMMVPNLAVRAVTTNLNQPTSMAFIGMNDFFVLEKASGKVQRIMNGELTATVLDLPLDPAKELRSLTVRTLANEVVIGLMSVTLERE